MRRSFRCSRPPTIRSAAEGRGQGARRELMTYVPWTRLAHAPAQPVKGGSCVVCGETCVGPRVGEQAPAEPPLLKEKPSGANGG